MIHIIKLKQRLKSNIFDIISSNPHMEYSKNAIKLGYIDQVNHTFKIDIEKLEYLLKKGCKLNRNLYYILKHYEIKLEEKFVK